MRVRWYCAQRICIPVSYRSLPKVETQDFASHEKVSAIYIDGKISTLGRHRSEPETFTLHYNGGSHVETQNLASHVESIATQAHNNALTVKGLPNCETQDFASLLFTGIIMNLRLSPYITVAASLWRRKILRLPLNPQQHTHTKNALHSYCSRGKRRTYDILI